jgi:hypothetical protein
MDTHELLWKKSSQSNKGLMQAHPQENTRTLSADKSCAFLFLAAFKPSVHTTALMAGFISAVSFLVLAGTFGDNNAKMARVSAADLAALGFLIVATGAHWVGQSGASVKDDVAIERMSKGRVLESAGRRTHCERPADFVCVLPGGGLYRSLPAC